MSTPKRASNLMIGDVLIRFGHRCRIVSVERCNHSVGGSVVKVTHTNGVRQAEVSYKPDAEVEIVASWPACVTVRLAR